MSIQGASAITKVVIPAAGIGTRLLSATKEQPKEMLPLFSINVCDDLCLKPLLQLVFEQLFNAGFRQFCFIVGRGKRAIEDHFTPDYKYIDVLNNKGKDSQALDLESFYDKIRKSNILWINQYEPKGFGHAVLLAKHFVGDEPFLVHAGDTYMISNENNHLKMLVKKYQETSSDAVLTLQEVPDPRIYGVAELIEDDLFLLVKKVVEKPDTPVTNLGIMPIYIFNSTIFKAIERIGPGKGNEIQLTDGVQKMIDWGYKVRAIVLEKTVLRLDIGTPKTYWEALKVSYSHFTRDKKEVSITLD